MNNIASELFNGIGVFKALYGLGRLSLIKARNRIVTPYRVEKLSDDVLSSNLSYGNVITVSGVVSRYGLTYRPLSYAPTIPARSSDKRIGLELDQKTRLLQEKRQTEAKFRLFQFPVQTLPPFEDENGKYCVAFIYPENFDGFILQEDPEKKGKSGPDSLLIDSRHRGIPVILPEETLENISESKITLTGNITLLPEKVTEALSNSICPTREMFYYGFLRPHSSRISFCIDCREKTNSDFNVISSISSLPAALYVEGHFDGIVEDKYKKEFKESIPNGLFWSFAYGDYPGKTFYLTSDENVSVIGSDPSIFGFYTETDIADERNFSSKLKHLESFYTEFRKKASNKLRKEHSIEARFKPDFLFDYKRQRYFHPDGALSSQDFDEVLKKHHEINEVAQWLKNEKQG